MDARWLGCRRGRRDAGHEVGALGAFAAGAKHRHRFTVALDGSAGNAYQGDTTSVQFDFNAA
jgi:hypothetical protein